MTAVREIHGRHLEQDIAQGHLVSDALSLTLPITNPAIYANITVGAEGTPLANQRLVTITLVNANGVAINYIQVFDVIVYTGAGGTALATTGGSAAMVSGGTGIVISQPAAKKHYVCQTAATGICTLVWEDTATETVALGVILPNKIRVMTAAFANA